MSDQSVARSVNLYNVPKKMVQFIKSKGFSFCSFAKIAIVEKLEKQFGKDWGDLVEPPPIEEEIESKKWSKDEVDYQAYICSKHWREVREAALKRTGYKCQLCSSKDRLSVHHNNYENMFKETETDVIVLCGKCHTLYHANERSTK